MKNVINSVWQNNKSLFIFLMLMVVFRSAVADWYEVPTGSMNPTIVEGDRIFAHKMAYDMRIPLTHISLVKMGDPKRGDIIIFDSAASNNRLIKRVIGLPGDRVEMQANTLLINGKKLTYWQTQNQAASNSALSTSYHQSMENLLGVKHAVQTLEQGSGLSSFSSVLVPKNKYLVMGDNRDNSADSRVIGFVPRDEIIGQAKSVIVSLDYENYYLPREGRFLTKLQ